MYTAGGGTWQVRHGDEGGVDEGASKECVGISKEERVGITKEESEEHRSRAYP
jgi:hypothetical protein